MNALRNRGVPKGESRGRELPPSPEFFRTINPNKNRRLIMPITLLPAPGFKKMSTPLH